MTIEDDGPEELGHFPDAGKPEAPPAGDEMSLSEWASNVAGGALLRDGLAPSVVGMIVGEALQEYARFRTSVKSPRRFLVKRILSKAELRRKLRGIVPPSDPEQGPHLLAVVHTRAALETLAPAARKALEMLFRDQKCFEEIAGALGLSVAGVRRLVSRALNRLRKWQPRDTEE